MMTVNSYEGDMTVLDKLRFNVVRIADASATGARLGRLFIEGRQPIETPSYVAITSRGSIPHLTPDSVEQYTSVPGVYLALEDCK
jgi:queuine tRNA-ribosyltransferase subunit QTRTD1